MNAYGLLCVSLYYLKSMLIFHVSVNIPIGEKGSITYIAFAIFNLRVYTFDMLNKVRTITEGS